MTTPTLPEGMNLHTIHSIQHVEYHDENTHLKVVLALLKAGLTDQQAIDVLKELNGSGIVFRESRTLYLFDPPEQPKRRWWPR